MALLFMDGFDHYDDAEALMKWDVSSQTTYSAAYARYPVAGYQGVACSSYDYFSKNLDPLSTIIVGVAFKQDGGNTPLYNSSNAMLMFLDGSTKQLLILMNASYQIEVRNGDGTLIATSEAISTNVWHYMEAKVVFSATVGAVTLKIDSSTVITETSVDTINSANEWTNVFRLGANYSANAVYYDDLYILDTTGTVNNDFIGDCTIETIRPTAAGNYSQWTPLSGDNYANVDDPLDIDSTTYNSTATIGNKDSYTLADMIGTGSILGVAINSTVRKDDAGAKTSKSFVRIGTTDYPADNAVSVFDTYKTDQQIMEINPADSASWEVADINAMESGIEIIS